MPKANAMPKAPVVPKVPDMSVAPPSDLRRTLSDQAIQLLTTVFELESKGMDLLSDPFDELYHSETFLRSMEKWYDAKSDVERKWLNEHPEMIQLALDGFDNHMRLSGVIP